MKRAILPLLFILVCGTLQGQNLVANNSFETYSPCPNTASQITYATGWNTSQNSPEYLNGCSASIYADVPTSFFGFQNAATGQAYGGALFYGSFAGSYIADLREFFYKPLTSPLVVGTTYYVSFKVNLVDNSEYAINKIGAQFCTSWNSAFPLNNTAHVFTNTVVTDKVNWTTISGTFVPTVAYNAVMIGNFFQDVNCSVTFVGSSVDIGYNAYYFVDDVYVGLTPPLAITLEDFKAENACTQNVLKWNTASEDEGDYFEVERSADAQSFEKIATVNAKYVTGGYYQLIDNNPIPGINYYRLKMIDMDGNFHYSELSSAQSAEGGFELDAYPNPVTDELIVRTSCVGNGTPTITIMDAFGRIVRTIPVTGGTTSVDLHGLATGYYFLHYQDDGVSKTTKVIKN